MALLLGVPVEKVRVIYTRGAGCYGLNGADTVSYDAALLSNAVGRPVRVQLTRQQEMAWGESYGFPYVIDQRAALDRDGTIVAWDYEAWFASRGGRPGYERPGNIVTGMLAGFDTSPFRPARAAEPPAEFNNRSNAAPSYVSGPRRARGRRGRHHHERASPDAHRGIALLHRTPAFALAPAEHLRARVASSTRSPRTSAPIPSSTGSGTWPTPG